METQSSTATSIAARREAEFRAADAAAAAAEERKQAEREEAYERERLRVTAKQERVAKAVSVVADALLTLLSAFDAANLSESDLVDAIDAALVVVDQRRGEERLNRMAPSPSRHRVHSLFSAMPTWLIHRLASR